MVSTVKLETERLILRPFVRDDAESMFRNWATDPDVIRFYTNSGCETLEATRKWVEQWLQHFDKLENNLWGVFAILLKTDGEVIGTIDYSETNHDARSAEVGYQIGKAWRGNGYAYEALNALIAHCFEEVGLNRIWAVHDPRNPSSGKVLVKVGMQYEGYSRQCKVRGGELVDRIHYAILKEDWDTKKEIEYYNGLPCQFHGFIEVPHLSNGEVYLVCMEKQPGNTEENLVPGYEFVICKGGQKIGRINLRIGYSDRLYYGGQIGYDIDEAYRGNGYAGQACRLLLPVAKAHKMEKLLITNDIDNIASKRVCEKLGARLVRIAYLPKWHDLYVAGGRFSNIYEWNAE